MATAMNTPDQISLLRHPTVTAVSTRSSITSMYEVSRCVSWIQSNHLARVALQFPDYLLQDASSVCHAIQDQLGQEVFILGDTSYGECCVDEVAASHLAADGVIHFGHTCLTPSQNLPVLYVFTRKECDVVHLVEEVKEKWGEEGGRVLLLYDVEYQHILGKVEVEGVEIVIGQCDEDGEGLKKFGRRFKVKSLNELDNYNVVYVGKGGSILLNFMFNLPKCEFFVFENSSLVPAGIPLSKIIMRRYFLVEKAKDADRIGLLVGTLGTANYGDILERLRKIIRHAGKKVYTFLVGKPNVAKLANFPEIDVFVLVACPETSFLDSKEFLQPIITPYELELACNKDQEWIGQLVTDYTELLDGGEKFKEMNEVEYFSDEEGDVSLISGKVRFKGGRNRELAGGGELMVVNDKTVSILHEGGGGQYLATRSWGGLEQKLGQTEVGDVVQGQKGIAAGYEGEPGLG